MPSLTTPYPLRWKKSSSMVLPTDIAYNKDIFPSFSSEELEKLRKHRPVTLHEASQIQGVTPHALIYLHSYVTRGKHHVAQRAAAVAARNGNNNLQEGEAGSNSYDTLASSLLSPSDTTLSSSSTGAAVLTKTKASQTQTSAAIDIEPLSPMHPDFSVSPQEADLRKHYQEIDDNDNGDIDDQSKAPI